MIAPRVVLFDLGNTLFYDRVSAWPRVYRRAEAALWNVLGEAGVGIPPRQLYDGHSTLLEYYYELRGDGIEEPGTHQVLSELLRRHGQDLEDHSIDVGLRAMYAVTQQNWRLEKGATEVLQELSARGLMLGAVTNVSDSQNALDLLSRAGIGGHFDVIVTSAAHGRRKPHADIFLAALDSCHALPGEAVMVGDSYEADIRGAHALGIPAIWVTRHARPMPSEMPVLPRATVRYLHQVPHNLA